MHVPALFLLLLTVSLPASAVEDFSGAWVAWLCPSGAQRDSGRCSNFVLELHQKDGRLCGAHFFSTAGAERIDEGMAPSVLGEVADDTATVVATSTRANPAVRVRVEMKKAKGMLHWLRLENPSGDYLLPQSTRLTRSRSKTLFAPVFEQELRAACLSAFTVAAENAAKKAQAAQEAAPAAGQKPSGQDDAGTAPAPSQQQSPSGKP
ncbi:MAG TPA: hypothetical protein VEC01_13380 [Noviherbaspirillum sp.]|uniref:hypothetical protein n=1 Tax=Noviherbaspirillum sp. TaxID=1926288 RepID=UPI002D23A656|nr:hypothetical protein [Noviherbaspirillum sp.]HYD96315.1 hypothetical protein [Noviherbaspirillum sp.]